MFIYAFFWLMIPVKADCYRIENGTTKIGVHVSMLLGFDMEVVFRFAVVPILQEVVSFFFERRN